MLRQRIIPVLLLRNGGLVKTIKFNKYKYIGDPINAIRIFNEKEVDELIVLDINASKEKSEPNFDLIEKFASECFMPLAYGGGITNIDQANQLFRIGVEKICIQSAAMEDPDLLSRMADKFGRQSIVASIDIKRNWLGKPKLYGSINRKERLEPWLEMCNRLIVAGAGEIMINAVDRDGTLSGPDLNLIKEASQALPVPVIALGGIASLEDIKATVDVGASAVAAGSFFVFQGPHRAVLLSYPKSKDIDKLFNKNV
jgi:cyclase